MKREIIKMFEIKDYKKDKKNTHKIIRKNIFDSFTDGEILPYFKVVHDLSYFLEDLKEDFLRIFVSFVANMYEDDDKLVVHKEFLFNILPCLHFNIYRDMKEKVFSDQCYTKLVIVFTENYKILYVCKKRINLLNISLENDLWIQKDFSKEDFEIFKNDLIKEKSEIWPDLFEEYIPKNKGETSKENPFLKKSNSLKEIKTEEENKQETDNINLINLFDGDCKN